MTVARFMQSESLDRTQVPTEPRTSNLEPRTPNPSMSVPDLRREYRSRVLTEDQAAADPIVQFRQWFDEALSAQALEANAMTLATAAPDGTPAARTVLLKAFDDEGFVFYTNFEAPRRGTSRPTLARACCSSGASWSVRCGSRAR